MISFTDSSKQISLTFNSWKLRHFPNHSFVPASHLLPLATTVDLYYRISPTSTMILLIKPHEEPVRPPKSTSPVILLVKPYKEPVRPPKPIPRMILLVKPHKEPVRPPNSPSHLLVHLPNHPSPVPSTTQLATYPQVILNGQSRRGLTMQVLTVYHYIILFH